jgi:hypothetical protein
MGQGGQGREYKDNEAVTNPLHAAALQRIEISIQDHERVFG